MGKKGKRNNAREWMSRKSIGKLDKKRELKEEQMKKEQKEGMDEEEENRITE